jgi:hypothetical protein
MAMINDTSPNMEHPDIKSKPPLDAGENSSPHSIFLRYGTVISVIGMVLFLGYYFLRFLFPFGIAFVIIIPIAISLSKKLIKQSLPKWKSVTAIILFLSTVGTYFFYPVVRRGVSYLYTPPALNEEKLAVYREVIHFFEQNNRYPDLALDKSGVVYVAGQPYHLGNPRQADKSAEELFSEEEILEMLNLEKKLSKVGCAIAHKLYKNIVFLTYVNSFPLDMILLSKLVDHHTSAKKAIKNHYRIFDPPSPGIGYFPGDRNPNEMDDPNFMEYKPFVKVVDHWYMSRKLALTGPMLEMEHTSIPKSLVDHSLDLPNVEIVEPNVPQ